ncbi:MAG: hypothetical protein M9921_04255 [Fimbriimonadaceae bacterium]|nr:hypothetical protein [Chthonomonadaceae bacterium]MCO5296048.1 hypothetical protein [Fimbriimonadaceae bacterium]
MPDEIFFLALASVTLGTAVLLVPFLLHHQRKMAEILHQKNAKSDELSQRLDALTDAVYQLASRVDHAVGKNGRSSEVNDIAARLEVPPRLG